MGKLSYLIAFMKQCHLCPYILFHLFRVGCTWYSIGIYYPAFETHPIISKFLYHCYLQNPPTVNILILGLWTAYYLFYRAWLQLILLLILKPNWKTAAVLALVKGKWCLHLTLICIENQHFFLQGNIAIFVSTSGGKTDQMGHLSP